jgi:hypothetical protein
VRHDLRAADEARLDGDDARQRAETTLSFQ